jgi:hypothetical protein
MREVILNYWNWFADLVNPYHDVINTISTIVIAAFAVILARVAWEANERCENSPTCLFEREIWRHSK